MSGKIPHINPGDLYTVEQAARAVMQVYPHISVEDAHRMVCEAIDTEKLPTADHREIALELADYLAIVRQGNEESMMRNDPVIRAHITKLAAWEKMVREVVAGMKR